MSQNGSVNWGKNWVFVLAGTGAFGIIMGVAIYMLKQYVGNYIEKKNSKNIEARHYYKFLACFVILVLISYCIVWFTYFPGICSYDFFNQVTQGIKNEYSSHHPLLHTLLIEFFLGVGYIDWGNAVLGIAAYCVLQMIMSLSVFTYGAWLLLRGNCSRIVFVMATIFSCALPLHGFMVCTVTKDSLFSVFFLFFVLLMIDIVWMDKKLSLKKSVFLLLASSGIMVMRNNGKYAMLVAIIVVLVKAYFDRKKDRIWSKIAAIMVISFVLSLGLLKMVENAYDCDRGNAREMMSVPIQQIARVVNRYPDALTEEEYAVLYNCIDREAIEAYEPGISDPVKEGVRTREVVNNIGDFAHIYFKLLLEYLGEYIDAFLEMIAGFVYVNDESSAWVNNPNKQENDGYGYIQTGVNTVFLESIGIRNMTFFPELYKRAQQWVSNNEYLRNPILRYTMAPGIWLYSLLFMIANDMTDKQYSNIVVFSLLCAYYFTLFLGPTAQMRYAYPMILCIAFQTLLYITLKSNGAKQQS